MFRHNCDLSDIYFHILYFPRDLTKIGFCYCIQAGIDNAFGFLPLISFRYDLSMDDSKHAEDEFEM